MLGLGLFLVLGIFLRDLTRVQKNRWLMAAAAIGLLGITLALGHSKYGAVNWISIGGLSFQPSEIAKICYIFAGSATLERLFRQYLDLPLLLGNDADCAAVAEFFCGAGKGTEDFAVVTLGTGIGVGLLLGGKLRGGIVSSEAGHIVMRRGGELCNCGRYGCWERYASATGLIRLTKEVMDCRPDSLLHDVAAQQGGVEGRTAFLAAEQGDEAALEVCREYVEDLADGAVSLINVVRPEVVAIGGGVAAAPEHLLLEPLREIVAQESFSSHGGRVTKILRAELGNDAGIIGAAFLGRVM